eukprot:SAG11_NODE_1376_length_5086_cov_19.924804_3_plen_80_part_00
MWLVRIARCFVVGLVGKTTLYKVDFFSCFSTRPTKNLEALSACFFANFGTGPPVPKTLHKAQLRFMLHKADVPPVPLVL